MTTRDYAAHPADLPTGTLVRLFLDGVDRFGDAPALGTIRDGTVTHLSYRDAHDLVRRVAGGLRSLGLKRGDTAAILAENRAEWALADYGCLCAGVRDVPCYSTLPASQIAYVLHNSGARLAFASTEEQVGKLLEIRGECPALEHIVVFDPLDSVPDGVMGWDAFLELGGAADDEAFRAEALTAAPEEVATVLYTSGTTGNPKGVMLTHHNLYSNIEAAGRLLQLGPKDRNLSLLPLSHVFQRMVDFFCFHQGCGITYPRSRETLSEDLATVKPTLMVGVPRVFEKVYGRIMDATGAKAKLVRWAKGVAEAWAQARLAGRAPGLGLKVAHALADMLVFKKIRGAVGGEIRFFVSGGGPLSPDINRFFFGAGLTILEGYGLTETSPVTNVNTFDDFSIGTVGKPVPGTEVRIADDGEILVRGPQVMKGYFRNPEATAEVVTPEGWFHTGDIGEIDAAGYLKITDRKKDIIVTSGGKNVAPQPIEIILKRNRYVEQPVIVGDGRKFVSLLVVPGFAELEAWASGQGIPAADRGALLGHRRVRDFLQDQIFSELKDLASFEKPKKIAFLTEEFTIEDGSLTPTEKVKRKVVEERLHALIDRLYSEEAVDQTVFVEGAG